MIDATHPDFANTPVSPQRPQFSYQPQDRTVLPCVTIITPFYNTGEIFYETARSVLQQSLQQWEWLIINDGSTDVQSLAILEKYRHCDTRIRVIDHETNKGLSAARNTGFRAAQAPYVVQIDSDDLLEPTAVEKWVWYLESYPEFAFVSGYSVGFGALEYLWEKGFHNGNAFREDNLVDATCAIRKTVHEQVGGYDETIREGCEDWDFWLRCANAGYWGGTLPEYLDWYRRRSSHGDRWANWGNPHQLEAFRKSLRERYPQLWKGKFPQLHPAWHLPNATVPNVLPWANALQKRKPRLLMILPWFTVGGADQFNLAAVAQLIAKGWEVSIATTLKGDHSWLPSFSRLTPDIFILHHFLRLVDYPRFLRYLISSRQTDVVMISNSELGYLLLPYLRATCPRVAFVDYCHAETEYWKNGGNPNLAVEYQELLDLNLVASAHLKSWMVKRGAQPDDIEVCYINVDAEKYRSDSQRRADIRRDLQLSEQIPVVLYVGRICAERPPQVLGQTLLQLKKMNEQFVAIVVGDGPDLDWLRAFIRRQGFKEQVRLLGAVANDRVRDLMTAADVFFLPSRWEGIALSIYEAMASGLAVVGADVGGQRELVTPECGVLVAKSNDETEARTYASVLSQLLHDPTQRQSLGRSARERVSTCFRLDQMGERIDLLLREAIRRHGEGKRPKPGQGLGHASASQAIEYVRLAETVEGLWQERTQAQAALNVLPHLLDPNSDSWRTLAYFTLRRLFFPYYHAGLNKNMRWLLPIKDAVKKTLLLRGATNNDRSAST